MNKKRSGFQVMARLIGLVKPMLGVMCGAIIMGCIGNLAAIFITILGVVGIAEVAGFDMGMNLMTIAIIIVVFAIIRGVLRYAEQACNHFIAFKLLARIRHIIFKKLREITPAYLEKQEKGNLISIITSDIEQLEVFYAHTISPIVIAVITSIVMCIFFAQFSVAAMITAAVFYLIVGVLIPITNHRKGADFGAQYRKGNGTLNTEVLDNLRGIDEILQYDMSRERLEMLETTSGQLENINKRLKKNEAGQRVWTDTAIILAGFVMLVVASHVYVAEGMSAGAVVITTAAMLGSFGPVSALSALSNNLTQTLASGARVLDILDEEPLVRENTDGVTDISSDIKAENVTFGYNTEETILRDFNIEIQEGTIHGILGESGCGKSTFLKLLMRFFETNKGSILYGKDNVNDINTSTLRDKMAYVTQDTFLFSDTIENNIKVSDENATKEAVIEAAKKASIHDFIMTLPKGYDTVLSDKEHSLSGGERQRIGIARAFLHNADILLLDEPTSNIDSLNESIILNSLDREKAGKTIIMVSHRKSTMGIADNVTIL